MKTTPPQGIKPIDPPPSIEGDQPSTQILEAHLAEAMRRLADARANPDDFVTSEELLARLQRQLTAGPDAPDDLRHSGY